MITKEKSFAPIAVVLIIAGALVLGVSIYFVTTKPERIAPEELALEEAVICAKESETIGARGMPELCCSGLKAVGGWPGGYQGDCSILPPPTGLNICANCGNKICESNNGENECNCPEDCVGDQAAHQNQLLIEWNKCKNREMPIDAMIDWRVKINFISLFGGLFAKGYIYDYKDYLIHIIWDSEVYNYGLIRQQIKSGDIIELKGRCEGVTLEGEVIVGVH